MGQNYLVIITSIYFTILYRFVNFLKVDKILQLATKQ
jgi:Na+/alanine symporter